MSAVKKIATVLATLPLACGAFAQAAYGPNYERLVALKNKYDPTNFFRMNHNIRPTIQAKSTVAN